MMIIYQIFTRLFGNRNLTRHVNGTILENGVGKMNDISDVVLKQVRELGMTHVWYTGVLRHATTTDYTEFGIPRQHPAIVKGKAGSPYAISDYYDIDPDLAVNIDKRMEEWTALIERTHRNELKVVMDFVPNHVARQYHSINKKKGIRDLGESDDIDMHFSVHNNFYYCTGKPFSPSIDLSKDAEMPYVEYPAKATGNDCFSSSPSANDWYETVKLNYGVDYCDAGGRSEHFDPIPDTWFQMTDILLFWASKGIDGFRCDMAEMVPSAFWKYATQKVKAVYPNLLFIGEVYDQQQYRNYITSGFDYLYDKVGMYDCLRRVICGHSPASDITYQWQKMNDIQSQMLYFLENHDEQRIASDFFCGDGRRAIPGLMVCALLQTNPMMVYAGQEFGERGMDAEGFSGRDGRTTIFDYWMVDTIRKGFFEKKQLSDEERSLALVYQRILTLARDHQVISKGLFFDLMYAQTANLSFNPYSHYAFLRKFNHQVLFIVVNFSAEDVDLKVKIPSHAFDVLHMEEQTVEAIDLLTNETMAVVWEKDVEIVLSVKGFGGRIYQMELT